MIAKLPALFLMLAAGAVTAAPASYDIDPAHTYPSFDADHMGMSVWRGKFNRNSGKILFDKATGQGSVEVVIDMASIDFGLEAMNAKAREADLFDVAKYPQATYKGKLIGIGKTAKGRVEGELTLHGVTRPVALKVNSFKCMPHPLNKRDWCGADAIGTFRRDQFGIDAGKAYGFNMNVTIRIQIEAVKTE